MAEGDPKPTADQLAAAAAFSRVARNVPLLEIVDRILAVCNEIDPETGEVLPLTEHRLDALNLNLQDKTAAYAIVEKRLRSDAEACREMSRQLNERARVRDAAREQLNERMRIAMEQLETRQIKTPTVTAYTQESESVEITDMLAVTEEYSNVKVERVPDKRKMLAALKAGELLPFARLRVNKTVRYR